MENTDKSIEELSHKVARVVSNFEEFKRQEYIGDSLMRLFAREFLFKPDCIRSEMREIEFELLSNKYLAIIAQKLEIKAHISDITYSIEGNNQKSLSNSLEFNLYRIYEHEGLEAARNWFIDSIYATYLSIKSV